ncbi:hypothetical protein GIB67_006683 [Kingdonia uniflora]|uniref:Uncharacterized protein n=1 Tax=Kingdonia uniflora TaxID=39325 RepID=A0A7J7LAR8_9MAGN|nr:hypothetical protein GIB67_006683 [Kingdonia uniflora]
MARRAFHGLDPFHASLNFELAKDDASNGIHGSNIFNFNVGAIVDLDIPRSFWNRLAEKYGNMFYWKEKSVQQRSLHDEVAQCEKTLQTLLNGGQEDLMSKVDSTVEACDDTLSLDQFHAKVMVRGKDFVHSVDWEQGSNPLEARVSTARQMLIKLRSIESQASKFPLLTSCTYKGFE